MDSEKDTFNFGTSKWAGEVLDTVLDEEQVQQQKQHEAAKVAVAEERKNRPIIDPDTGRDRSRVLFVTTNRGVLEDNSLEQKHYLEAAPEFDEVHIMVFVQNRHDKTDTKRIANNVWVYPVYVFPAWHVPFAAADAAKELMVFNDSVRPDIVVGVDMLGAGFAAYLISRSLKRPWQLHVKNNVFDPLSDKYSFWHRLLARFVLGRAKSIRTKTKHIKEIVSKYCSKKTDIKILPSFYNFSGLKDIQAKFDLHEKYPSYAFIILTFGPYTADSPLHDAFTATHGLLQNPRIGMVVAGSGPAKKLFEDKANILGVSKSIVFASSEDDVNSMMKTADALLELSDDEEGDERVMRAATLGLPVVAVETELRKDLFSAENSALLCPAGDKICLGQQLNKLLNSGALRKRFAEAEEYVVSTRLKEDPEEYHLAYRDSIETVLVPEKPSK